jgi:hypothetical protein
VRRTCARSELRPTQIAAFARLHSRPQLVRRPSPFGSQCSCEAPDHCAAACPAIRARLDGLAALLLVVEAVAQTTHRSGASICDGTTHARTAENGPQVGGDPRQSDKARQISHQLGSKAFWTALCNSLDEQRAPLPNRHRRSLARGSGRLTNGPRAAGSHAATRALAPELRISRHRQRLRPSPGGCALRTTRVGWGLRPRHPRFHLVNAEAVRMPSPRSLLGQGTNARARPPSRARRRARDGSSRSR